jgi:ribosomal protein L11 methylase PrmA
MIANRRLGWLKLPQYLLHRSSFDGEPCFVFDDWVFNEQYGYVYLSEKDRWVHQYIPPTGLNGKVVLDVGAGCGETAKFFLDHGASSVVAVENDQSALRYLKRNAERNPIEVIDESFAPSMLSIEHDYMKMDIEGWESLLFFPNVFEWYDKDCSIESHSNFSHYNFLSNGFKADRKMNNVSAETVIMQRWREKWLHSPRK